MDEIVRVFDPPTLFRVVDVLGVIANALLGGLIARRMRFDLVGFLVLGILSGLGGGLIRDMLLTTRPVALTDPAYLAGAVAASAVAYLVTLHGKWLRRGLLLADVLAVGCWTATGTIKALGYGLGAMPAILLGVTTAVGGGLIRDVVTGKIPAIFGGSTLYATIATAGSLKALVLTEAGLTEVGMGASILTCAVLGVLAQRFGWSLPAAPEWSLPGFRPRPPGMGPSSPPSRALASGERRDHEKGA